MKIEHFAINVKEPVEMAAWYVEHLGLKIIRGDQAPPYITFLADDANETVLELYANPHGEFPDYADQSVFTFHIALAVDEIEPELKRLVAAGATAASDLIEMDGGVAFRFVKDPWGVTWQLITRERPLFE